MSAPDPMKEITALFHEAAELNRKIGKLESAIKHGTALPNTQPFDFHAFVERIALPTLEKTDGPSHI